MNKFLMTILLCAGSIAYGQDFDLTWGAVSKASSSDAVYAPLGWYNGFYYTLKVDNGNGYLLKADNSLTLKAQPELITGQKKFNAELAMFRNGQLLILASEYEKDQQATIVQAWIFKEDGKPTSTKMKTVAKFPVEKSREAEDVSYRLSADSSLILISMDHNMPNKEDAKFSLAVIGADDLKKVWETQATVPYADTDFSLLSTAVDRSGNAIALGVIRGGDGKRLAAYSTRAFVFNTASEKYDDRELKIDNKYISSAFIQFTAENQLMISGFYNGLTAKGKNEGIEGAFIASTTVDNLASLDLKVMAISPTTKAAITPTSSFAKWIGADELNAYNIRNINMRPDGSGYVIAEQRFMVRSVDGNTETRSYYFNHIIAYSFDAAQNIEWISSVPKEQVTSMSAPVLGIGPVAIYTWTNAMTRMAFKYNSYQQVEINNTIYLLYNDHRDNGDARSMKECKTMSNKKNANGVIVAIGPDGKWEKTTLFAGKEVDVILESSSCLPIPGVGFTISAEKGKDLQLGTLTLR